MTLAGWIGLLAALALFFGAQGSFWLLRARRRRSERELAERLLGPRERLLAKEGAIRIRRVASERRSYEDRLAMALEQGAIKLPARTFVAIWAAVALALAVLLGWSSGSAVSGVAVVVLVAAVAWIYVSRRRTAQLQLMSEELPRALELIVLGLRAGHALEEAIGVSAHEVEAPLSGELQRCYEEYKLGRPIEGALEAMRERWPTVRPIGSFVEAVAVLKRTGGNLIEVMETLVTAIRAQAAFEARHRALTAEGKTSAAIVMIIPFLAFIGQALLAPAQIEKLVHDSAGQKLLLLGAALWAVGSLWTLRLTRIGTDD